MAKTNAELIAEFLATKGATKIAAGVQTMDEKQMYNAVRGRDINAGVNTYRYVENTYYGEVLVNQDGEPV